MQRDTALAAHTAGEPDEARVRATVVSAKSAWIESVYDLHARELWAVFYAYCCDPELAREALQEVFLRLHFQDRHALRDVKAWLARVGGNWLRDAARRRRHAARPAAFLDDLEGPRHGPPDLLEAGETQAFVRTCLGRLREEDRQVLVLRYALDWSSVRIAETLDSTPAAIDMRLSRARRRLAKMLQTEDESMPGL